MHGVWAKWERAVEQLAELEKDVATFCAEPYPYTVHSHEDRDRGRYRFDVYPAWAPGAPYRWGAIIGEIVHDLRSALDNLVCQLVLFNGRGPDVGHAFPVLAKEHENGFANHMRRQWTDRRGRQRHGPLWGVCDDATAIIEAVQPFKRADGLLLQRPMLCGTSTSIATSRRSTSSRRLPASTRRTWSCFAATIGWRPTRMSSR